MLFQRYVKFMGDMNSYIILMFFILNIKVRGESDKTFKIVKAQINKSQWKLLEKEENDNRLDIFSKRLIKKGKWDVVFEAWPDTVNMLRNLSIRYKILPKNTSSVFEVEQENQFRRFNGFVNQEITFSDFVTYDEIISYLKRIPELSSAKKKITAVSIGKTIENRNIMMVKIKHRQAKNLIIIDAGIHAREWLSVMQALYIIEQIIAVDHSSKLSSVDWYIIPSLNPDGYTYSQTPGHRLQRKNRNKLHCLGKKCEDCGVDLNRNFGYKFGFSGTSNNPCAETYTGPYAFSEPEARALRDVFHKYANKTKLYLTLHSYGCLLLYPWGYTSKMCDDWKDLRDAAVTAKKAIEEYSGQKTNYTVGNTGKDFYPAAGGSDDYAKYLGIKYSYTMELQSCNDEYEFEPPKTIIKQYVQENFAGIAALVEYIENISIHKKLRGVNLSTQKDQGVITDTISRTIYIAFYVLFWYITIN